MKYSDMKSETKEVVQAVLTDKCSYFLKEGGLVMETTDNEIFLMQKETISQGVIESVVDVVRAFCLFFYIDTKMRDMIIRIY